MFIIGVSPYGGLYDTTKFLRGDIPAIGTRGMWTDPATGETREFVSVKFTSGATHINGSLVTISSAHVATLGSVGAGPALTVTGGRLGILTFGSATTTQTMAGTAFGWAQIYGPAKARIVASVADGIGMVLGADGIIVAAAAGSASAMVNGIVTMATASTSAAGQLLQAFLNYPRFAGIPA
jgi:hypothetical protein